MKVIHLTTWQEVCGIATYTSNLINNLENQGINNEIYPINRTSLEYLSFNEIREHFANFCRMAKDFDIVHIQHEHGFFHGSYPFDKSIDIFHDILIYLKKHRKKVVVTFHTDPIFVQSILKTFKEGSSQLSRNLSNSLQTWKWKSKIAPFFNSSNSNFTALVHTKKSRLLLINSGFAPESIKVVKHGITTRYNTTYSLLNSQDCKSKIDLDEGCKLLSIFGFVSGYKGYEIAINALKYLPSQYYLAIIGGTHPNERHDKTIDRIFNLIIECKLQNRVRITGFVDFEVLDLYHAATDICLAPYLSSTLSASGALTWALNSGKPIIASKIPAFYELNQEVDCMSMITPECSMELAWQILNLDKDEQLKEQLVKNAFTYVNENSWDKISSIHIEIYKNLMFN
ncbi:glycosyltransferase [Hassallia byssoidea VB512170]|uniref:Glycosyltransferase n=1 Tax=Hassallia byssoidea VB512170 TaxID=1304833 RepID=A0A846H9W1_9CYAN|nr:glycosyltransferase [Hassalia byssoidea]NEU74135.1 glycosyltransferase [Hassalia byssoidea VB512170]